MATVDRPVVAVDRDSGGNLFVGPAEINEVVEAALANGTGRARINAHSSMDSSIHEMVIAFRGGSYVRPHRHRTKRESFHVIRGRLDAVTFDHEGQVKQRVALGAYDSGLPFYLRNEHNDWHCFVIVSEVAIVHETTNGPFDKGESEFPAWAPDPADEESVRAFLSQLG